MILFHSWAGAQLFARLLNKLVGAARADGFVVHAIDAVAIKANMATWGRIDRHLADHDDNELPLARFVKFEDVLRDTPYPKVAYGRKNNSFYGYMHHLLFYTNRVCSP